MDVLVNGEKINYSVFEKQKLIKTKKLI